MAQFLLFLCNIMLFGFSLSWYFIIVKNVVHVKELLLNSILEYFSFSFTKKTLTHEWQQLHQRQDDKFIHVLPLNCQLSVKSHKEKDFAKYPCQKSAALSIEKVAILKFYPLMFETNLYLQN